MLHRINQRQCGLALGQIVTHVLADNRVIVRIIEDIVDELKCGPQMSAISSHRFFDFLTRVTQNRAHPRRRFEQLSCLVANDLQVAFLIQIGIAAVHQLQHFAFSNHIGRIGEHPQHGHVLHAHHQLERSRVNKIAHQNRGCVAEERVRGRLAPTQTGLVDYVVMQQRRGMDELDHRSKDVMLPPLVAASSSGEHHQGGPQPLPAAADDVLRDLPDERHLGIQAVAYHPVDGVQVGGDELAYCVDRQSENR